MSTQSRPITVRRNTTIPEPINALLEELAIRAGHGNVSRLIQDLAKDEAVRVIGNNWQAVVAERLDRAA